MTSALDHQVAGTHYLKHAIQPIEFIHANQIGFAEGNVIKYLVRWRDRGGIRDLEKAKHYIELLIEMETQGLEKLKPHDQNHAESIHADPVGYKKEEIVPMPPAPDVDE